MKRLLLPGVAVALALTLAACGGGDSDPPGANVAAGGDKPAGGGTATTKATDAPNTVLAKGLAFKPSTLRVKVGDTVTFKFDDGAMPHNAVADDGSFDTGLKTRTTVPVVINKAGRIPYVCTIHPTMKGTIIAE